MMNQRMICAILLSSLVGFANASGTYDSGKSDVKATPVSWLEFLKANSKTSEFSKFTIIGKLAGKKQVEFDFDCVDFGHKYDESYEPSVDEKKYLVQTISNEMCSTVIQFKSKYQKDAPEDYNPFHSMTICFTVGTSYEGKQEWKYVCKRRSVLRGCSWRLNGLKIRTPPHMQISYSVKGNPTTYITTPGETPKKLTKYPVGQKVTRKSKIIEGEKAKVLSDEYGGLDQDAVVTVLKIKGDDVKVADYTKEEHTVKKSDLETLKSGVVLAYSRYFLFKRVKPVVMWEGEEVPKEEKPSNLKIIEEENHHQDSESMRRRLEQMLQ